jgi:hypothetical protein
MDVAPPGRLVWCRIGLAAKHLLLPEEIPLTCRLGR